MKKSLILALMLAITTGSAIAASTEPALAPAKQAPITSSQQPQKLENPHKEIMLQPPHKKNVKAQFDKRLNLTEEQKALAKDIRKKGHEEMKPVMDKIKDLKQEKEMVKLSRMSIQAQEEKIAELDTQIKDLKKQAHEMRAKNMKEFEAILTDKQKKELAKMKKEGRKNFEKNKKRCEKEIKCDCPMVMPKPPVEK